MLASAMGQNLSNSTYYHPSSMVGRYKGICTSARVPMVRGEQGTKQYNCNNYLQMICYSYVTIKMTINCNFMLFEDP